MDRTYAVYLPAGYENSDREYPVLYLLHPAEPANTIPNQQSWFYYGGLKHYLDAAIASGEITPMIVVTPDANFGSTRISYFNDPTGAFNFEDFFFQEFMPHVEATYRCRTEKDSRALAGASLGAGAVFQYAVHQPNAFAVACALSGAVRKYDVDYLQKKFPVVGNEELKRWYEPYDVITYFESLPEGSTSGTKFYISCGDDDHLSPNNAELHVAMKGSGIDHEFRIENGAHDWAYWRQVLPAFMTFISDSFRK